MHESPYRVLGADIPALMGRAKLSAQLWDRLMKPTPDHVAVVGPRHYGKTVLLKHLADTFPQTKADYIASAYWDLRHNTPTTHAELFQCFANVLKGSLCAAGEAGLADYLEVTDGGSYDALEIVRDELAKERRRVLVVMDGFDHVLANDGISRHTWDAMRSLSQKRGLVLVTGSRRSLRELCLTAESASSDFWEVFHTQPLRVGRFNEEDDWVSLVKPFEERGIAIDKSAQAEIVNWTGGIPTLVVLLLDSLYCAASDDGALGKPDVDRVAADLEKECRDVVGPLWEECDEDLKGTYLDLVKEGKVRSADLHAGRREELLQRGLARVDGTLVRASARLVGNYARQQSSSLETMQRLFGDPESFVSNAKSVLEIRLRQLRIVDNSLHKLIRLAIESLNDPSMSLMLARGIANRAIELIWQKEAPEGVIPMQWDAQDRQPGDAMPNGGGAVNLLRQLTGTDRAPRKTKSITKRTYVLVSFIHSAGDHGQHLPAGEGTGPYVVAFCLAAIELAESLALDLGST